MSIMMALTAGVLCACGAYLVLGRQLSRVVIGIGLIGHGANVLLVFSGRDGGEPAFVGSAEVASFADPLPQAFALTAIVITFGVIAFLLAMAYRSWVVSHDDEVEDDVEDRRIAAESHHHHDHASESEGASVSGDRS